MGSTKHLPLRAAFAVIAMPGLVAGFLPWSISRGIERWPLNIAPFHWAGLLIALPAFILFAWTVRDFFVRGEGTLAPWDPPKFLVAEGSYRWSRNPMYVGVVGMICGQGIIFRSGEVLLYGAVMAVIFHLRVILGEEPWLARTFPEPWAAYTAKVRRWGLFVLCLVVAPPASAQTTHPTAENFTYPAATTIRRSDTISGDPALDALARRLRALRPATHIGGEDAAGGADFGEIVDVTLDPQGRILVLDKGDNSVSRWTSEGAAEGRFGRAGRGPLEFYAPTGLLVQPDGTIMVLDRALGLKRFTWASTPLLRDIQLQGETFDDICASGRGVAGRRVNDDGSVVQLIDADGVRRHGVGRQYQSRNPMAARDLSRGRVGCLPNGRLAGNLLLLPFIWIWDTAGKTIATTQLLDFTPMEVTEIDRGLTYGSPRGGYEMFRKIVPVGPEHLLVQLAFSDSKSMRERAEYAELRSYLLSSRTGKGVYLGTSLPIIAGGALPTLVGWRNDPVPEVVLLR